MILKGWSQASFSIGRHGWSTIRSQASSSNGRHGRASLLVVLVLIVSACGQKDLNTLIYSALDKGLSEVVIPSGYYVVDEAIVLDGVEDFVVRKDSDARVSISTSMELTLDDFKCLDEEKGIYEITLPELISEPWPDAFRGYAGWPEVYINGEALQMARFPDHGFIKIDSIIHPGSTPRTGDSTNIGARFTSKQLTEAIAPIVIPLYLDGYWKYKWYDEVLRVESIDPESGEIKMAAAHNYGVGPPSGGLFYALNQPEFLDKEGEYYFNPETGTLQFIMPRFGKRFGPIITIGYQDFTLFKLKDCRNVRFENLEITDHNGLVFDISDSDSIVILGCRITNLAQSAIQISGGSNCSVLKTQISEIGGTGISLDGGDKKSLTHANHSVIDCRISHFSKHIKTYSPAVKLDGVGHIVRRNGLSNGPHCAIFFTGNDHLIENNHISHVCLNTSDAGAIYCGRDWTMGGTIIQKNSIEQLGQASHHHNWAIYLDDLASGIQVLDNLIVECPSGILVGGGRYNKINGNTIRNCKKASIMYDARGLGWANFFVSDLDNIMWERLNEVPIDQPPWSERFPWLQELAEDDPAIPKHNEILNNEIFHSAKVEIHPTVYQYGKVDVR